MGKKKDKKKAMKRKKKELVYSMDAVIELATTVIAINPYVKDMTIDEMSESILQTVQRAFIEGAWCVSTTGWFAHFDEWEKVVFVDFYVQSFMTYNKLFPKDTYRVPV